MIRKVLYDVLSAGQAGPNRVERRSGSDGCSWYYGPIGTPHGWVVAYSEERNSRLDFIYQGRRYIRYGPKATKRGLSIIAGRFVDAVVKGEVPDV